jgi:tRNA 2-selenouridine synthase
LTHVREPARVTVAQLPEFDEIIDVRSEGEFAADHIDGAINCPVLDDGQRARIGTIYKQRSPFEARKLGSALVSGNISRHLHERFLDRPRDWRPLVYCWRGGQRSAAFAHVLAEVGWHVGRLDGGYRAYRRAVIEDLERLPDTLQWRVICGLTGTGKSRLLRALDDRGAQVIDLEALAAHRGSVLGNLPDNAQPPQKLFESRLWTALRSLSPARPVFVEAESSKIGELRVPVALSEAMRNSVCVVLEAPVRVRVVLLKQEYRHFIEQPAALIANLERLIPLHGQAVVERWKQWVLARAWDPLTEDLLLRHYDPAYARSIANRYPGAKWATRLTLPGATDQGFAEIAQQVLGTRSVA